MKPLIFLLAGIVLAMIAAIVGEVSEQRTDAARKAQLEREYNQIMEKRAYATALMGHTATEKAPKPAEVRVKLATWLGELKGLRGPANERARIFASERINKEIDALIEELKFTNLPAQTALREVQSKLFPIGYSGDHGARGLEAAIAMAEAQLQGLQ